MCRSQSTDEIKFPALGGRPAACNSAHEYVSILKPYPGYSDCPYGAYLILDRKYCSISVALFGKGRPCRKRPYIC